MVVCDDDGFAEFDLESQTAISLDGQPDTDYSVTYYASQAEADAAATTTALSNTYTNVTNPHIIYVRVEDIDAVGLGTTCYSTFQFMISADLNDDPSFTLTATCTGATAVIAGDTGGTFTFNAMDEAIIDPVTGEISNAVPGAEYTVEYTTAGICPMTLSHTITIPDEEDATFTATSTCDR